MKTLLASWKEMLVAVALLSIIGGLEKLVSWVIQSGELAWEGQCTPQSWEGSGDALQLTMSMKCDKSVRETRNTNVIASYLNNPGPLPCKIFKTGSLECGGRPPLGTNKETEKSPPP